MSWSKPLGSSTALRSSIVAIRQFHQNWRQVRSARLPIPPPMSLQHATIRWRWPLLELTSVAVASQRRLECVQRRLHRFFEAKAILPRWSAGPSTRSKCSSGGRVRTPPVSTGARILRECNRSPVRSASCSRCWMTILCPFERSLRRVLMEPFHHSTAAVRSVSDAAWSTLCGSSTTT